jgi:hypothetical protein
MGSKQFGFGDYVQTTAKKRTKRGRFMSEMEKPELTDYGCGPDAGWR